MTDRGLGVPVGWAVLAAAVLIGGAVWYDGSDGEREGPERTNCPPLRGAHRRRGSRL